MGSQLDRNRFQFRQRRRTLLAIAAVETWGLCWHAEASQLTAGAPSTFTTSESDSFVTFDTTSLTFNSAGFNNSNPLAFTLATTLTTNPVLTIDSGQINVNGGGVAQISGGTLTNANTGGAALFVNATGTLILNSALGNSSGLPLSLVMNSPNGGVVVLNSQSTKNTFSGGVLLQAGTIQISADANLGGNSGSTNGVTFAGATNSPGGVLEFTSAFTVNSGRVFNFSTGNGTVSIDGGLTTTFVGNNQFVSGAGLANFIKDGAGTLDLSSTNSFSQSTVINAGTLELNYQTSLNAKSTININTGAVLQLRSDGPFVMDSTGNSDENFGNNVNITGSSATIDVPYLDVFASGGNYQLNSLNLTAAATLNVTDSNSGVRSLEFTGNSRFGGTATISNAAPVFLSGQLSGSGGLTLAGSSTLSIDGTSANTYSGATTVSSGALILNKTANTVAIPGNLILNGGTVTLMQPGQISSTSTLSINGGLFNLNGQTDSLSSLTNNGGNIQTGSGTLVTTGTGTTLTLISGNFTVNSGGTVDPVMVVQGGTNTVQANGQMIAELPSTVQTSSVVLTFDSVIPAVSPTIMLNADPALPGRLLLKGSLAYVGSGTSLMGVLGNQGNLAGTLDLNANIQGFSIGTGPVGVDMMITSTITDGGIDKQGAGTLQLCSANSYSMGTTLELGTVQITDPGALGFGYVNFSGGTLDVRTDASSAVLTGNNTLYAAPTISMNLNVDRITQSTPGLFSFQLGAITLGTALNVTGNSNGTIALGAVTLGASPTINNTTGLAINGAIIGPYSITKTMSGTLAFSGNANNTYSGSTSVYTGTLLLNKSSGAIAVPGALNIVQGATVTLDAPSQIASNAVVTLNSTLGATTLNLNGFSQTIGSLVDSGFGGSIQLGTGGSLAFGVADTQSPMLGFVVSGSGLLVKNGTYIDTFGGTNTYTGGVTVNSGGLSFSNTPVQVSASHLTGGAWTVFGGAILTLPGSNHIQTIDSSATVTLNGVSPLFAALNTLATNNGTFNVTNGATVPVTSFINAGNFLIGPSSAITFSTGLENQPGIPGSTGVTVVSTGGTLQPKFIWQNLLSVGGTVSISSIANGGAVSVLQNLNMTGGTLDVANSNLIVHAGSTSLNTLTVYIILGRNGGLWNGAGLTSSLAASDTTHLTSLGVMVNQTGIGGPTIYANFGNQPVVATDMLVKYTYYGDANCDGKIDGSDYSRVDHSFLSEQSGPNVTGWYNGDFNYDFVVNGSDYTLIDNAYNRQTAQITSEIAGPQAEATDQLAGSSSLPEPGMLMWSAFAVGLLHRRRSSDRSTKLLSAGAYLSQK